MDSTTTIAACFSQKSRVSGKFDQAIQALGYSVVRCEPDSLNQIACCAIIVEATIFPTLHSLEKFLSERNQPVLVIADSVRDESAILAILGPEDDVCTANHALTTIPGRLAHLVRRQQRLTVVQEKGQRDQLTGLLDRSSFFFKLNEFIEVTLPGEARALVLFDIDHFKQINDQFGHQAGDRVIAAIGQVIRQEAAPQDLVGRIGGEEFAWAIQRYDWESLESSIEAVRHGCAENPGGTATEAISFTVSAGWAKVGMDSVHEELTSRADKALYRAKSEGRNRVVSYESMEQAALAADEDLDLQNFEAKTRVYQERMVDAITALGRRLVKTARAEANNDALTTLNNRRFFDRGIARECEIVRRHSRALSVVMLDIDHFHDVNMKHGWPTGDLVLRKFGELALEHIRVVDWMARYGGEEFCIIMPETEPAEAILVAERIRQATETAVFNSVAAERFSITVSIGIARFDPQAMAEPLHLMQAASQALLEAKNSGRNRIVTFIPPGSTGAPG